MRPMLNAPFARRAVLKSEGCPEVRLEVHRNHSPSFGIVENGKARTFWTGPTPQSAIQGTWRPLTLDQVWEKLLREHYAGYQVTELEELCPCV
jgi:hypothetical protein